MVDKTLANFEHARNKAAEFLKKEVWWYTSLLKAC